ncbi:MAG: transposase [Saprospiraceae bacterium]
MFIVIDSTGLKVYGKVNGNKEARDKQAADVKLHLAVDEKTGLVIAHVLTENGKGDRDAQQVEEMLGQVEPPVDRFSGDGAYDTCKVWVLLKNWK